MKPEEFKALTTSIKEMSEETIRAKQSIKSATASGTGAAKKLWKSENRSWLIKAGVALLVFPDPTISDVLGVGFLAAGAVHEGIKRQAVYVDDLPKAFNSAMRDLKRTKSLF